MNTDKMAFTNWLLWVRKVSPELYALFKIKNPEIINALDDSRLGFAFNWGSILDAGTKFVQTALPIYQQQKQFKQQLELAKLQLQAPAAFQQQAPTPNYAPVAVPVSTPTSVQTPQVTPTGQQVLEIRIDKGQIAEVKQEAQAVKAANWQKYLPLMLGGAALLIVLNR